MALAAGLLVLASTGPGPASAAGAVSQSKASSCDLESAGGRIQHVISITFDNTHFMRDDPNVPSDLAQMPNLLNFITGDGTLISHEHTPLIAHTGTDILSSLTGLYGDQMGAPVSNAFGFYDGVAKPVFRSMFQYWTARLGGRNDNTFNMITPSGKNTPAPWVPFTRAGCSYGAVATANVVLENTFPDIASLFGPNSPESQEEESAHDIPCGFTGAPPCTPAQRKAKNQPAADFVGLAVHCGESDSSCASSTGHITDSLPDEPGGYQGFSALVGAKYVDPFISPSGPATDLDGHVIADSTGNPGFPGFDGMSASTSLGLVATMQERGVPITTAYIADAHDNHAGGGPLGPGEAGYVATLRSYDDAFGKFFARLAKDGINRSNTLFTFTSDEGDHFVGGQGAPAGCDGVHVHCTYAQKGELDANLTGLFGAVPPYSTGTPVPNFSVHSDSAPTVYIYGNPSQTDAVTRNLERGARDIEGLNPITNVSDRVTNLLAGAAAMRNLHMLTGDSNRNPTFTLFADPNYFLCAADFSCPEVGTQVVEEQGFAWNHGDVAPEINTTWLGLVGPGVLHMGVNDTVWSTHTDDRPTMLALLGLKDDYRHQGRVLVEVLDRGALSHGVGDTIAYARLARVYEQLDSSVGQFGLATLKTSTRALESGAGDPGDSVYTSLNNGLATLGRQRDELTGQMLDILDRPVSAAVPNRDHDDGSSINALRDGGLDLLQQAWLLAGE